MTYEYLQRNYGVVTAAALVVANMVGAGIFSTTGVMAGQLPNPCSSPSSTGLWNRRLQFLPFWLAFRLIIAGSSTSRKKQVEQRGWFNFCAKI